MALCIGALSCQDSFGRPVQPYDVFHFLFVYLGDL